MKSKFGILFFTAVLAAGTWRAALGEDGKGSAAPNAALQESIKELSSDSFKAREKAVQDIRLAMGEQLKALISTNDAASRAQAMEALGYQSGLSQWALETLKLPNEQRKSAMDFGLRPEVMGVLAQAFSPNVGKRVEGIKALAKFEDGEATTLIARLVQDRDRKVSAAAMEAAGSRKATKELVDALWSRAIGPSVMWGNPLFAQQDADEGMNTTRVGMNNSDESEKACEVLIKLNSPLVAERMAGGFKALDDADTQTPGGVVMFSMLPMAPLKNFLQLVPEYKPAEAYATIYREATGPAGQTMNIPGKGGFYSTGRTLFIATFIKLIGEKPEDYKLKPGKMAQGSWMFPTEADEKDAISKIQEWWGKHGREHGDTGAAAVSPASSQPAEVGK